MLSVFSHRKQFPGNPHSTSSSCILILKTSVFRGRRKYGCALFVRIRED